MGPLPSVSYSDSSDTEESIHGTDAMELDNVISNISEGIRRHEGVLETDGDFLLSSFTDARPKSDFDHSSEHHDLSHHLDPSLDRIILINPVTPGMVVIRGSAMGFDSLLNDPTRMKQSQQNEEKKTIFTELTMDFIYKRPSIMPEKATQDESLPDLEGHIHVVSLYHLQSPSWTPSSVISTSSVALDATILYWLLENLISLETPTGSDLHPK
ncbi:hypothetical protein L6452_27803 [Arctium lappa]|uniref:Uncharacterized protein n=1 Tax=Arctium lappa TaxID=4217 RepID=A0ACB8ZWS6_ARCLA|nr:hypothetical protein L6452_27803 [Arctium lappa]